MKVHPGRFLNPVAPALVSAIVLGVTALAIAPARAESVRGGLTREDGMNAVRYAGDTWTLPDLIARRELNPLRFDLNHQRLGYGLRMGIDGLQQRRSLNPRRFDYYHPVFAHLLDDFQPDDPSSGLDPLGGPDLPPELITGDSTNTSPTSRPLGPAPPILPPIFEEPPSVLPPPPGPQTSVPQGAPPTIPGASDPPIDSSVAPSITPTVTSIPEPPGLVLSAVGLLGLCGLMGWKRLRARRLLRSA